MQEFKRGEATGAFPIFKKLADKGDKKAAYYLGEMYQFGDGAKVNGDKAIHWLSVAATAGNVNAERQLGLLYLDGVVTVQDFSKARKWLDAAAQQGDEVALRNLGDMDKNGLGAPTDPVMAYAYYSAAATRGYRHASAMRDQLAASLSPERQRAGEKKAQAILAGIAARGPKPKSQTTPTSGQPTKSGVLTGG